MMQCWSPMSEHCKQPLARRMLPTEGMEVCSKSERAQDLLHSEKSVVVSAIQCVENSQQLVDVAAPAAAAGDERYSVSRAKMERLNDHALGATEAMIEKIENRYVTLLEQELEKQAQADQSLTKPRQVTNTLPEAASTNTLPEAVSVTNTWPEAASVSNTLPEAASTNTLAQAASTNTLPEAALTNTLPSNTAMQQTLGEQCVKLNKSATQNVTDCVSATSAMQNDIGRASVVQNVTDSTLRESVVQNVTDSASVVQNVTHSESVVQNVTDSTSRESVVQNVTDSGSVVQNVTHSESVVQNVTDSASVVQNVTHSESVVQNVTDSASVVQNVTDSESVVQNVTDSASVVRNVMDIASRDLVVQSVTDSAFSGCVSQKVKDRALNKSALQGIRNNVISNSTLEVITNNASLATENADLASDCGHNCNPESRHSQPKLQNFANGSEKVCTVPDSVKTTSHSVSSMEQSVDEHRVRERTSCVTSNSCQLAKTAALTNGMANDTALLVEDSDERHLKEKLECDRSVQATVKLKACTDDVLLALKEEQRLGKVALQDAMKERLGCLNGVVNHMSNGTDHRDHRDNEKFAAEIQEELLEKAAILSMEAKAKKNEKDSDLRTAYENGCLASSATPQQNSMDANHQQPNVMNSCPTFSNCVSQLPTLGCVTGDSYLSNKGDVAGSYPCGDSQMKQTLLAGAPVIEQGQGDSICLVVTGKAPSLAANVLCQQQLLQQISLGDNSENSSTSSQGELSAALLQQPANSGMSALERAALAADIPGAAEVAAQGAAEVAAQAGAMQGQLAVQGAMVQASQMMAIAPQQMVMAVAPQHQAANSIQPVSIQGIMSQAQLVGHMMQQSGQPIVMQGQQLMSQGQQIQIVSGQASTAAVGQPHMLLPNIQLVAGAQPLFFSPQHQQQMLTSQILSQPMVGQPQVQLLPSANNQQQQVLVSIQPQQQLRFVSPLAQQTDSPAQFHVQIVPGAPTNVATVPVSQQINVVNILPQPVAAKQPQVITVQHQAVSAPPRIQPMPSASAPSVVTSTATPSSGGSQLSPTSAARRPAKSPLGSSRPSKRKKAARSRSNSSETRSDTTQSGQKMAAAQSAQQYMCEWAGCQR